jgi:hypothetical protein
MRRGRLVLVFLYFDGLEVFGLEDLTAVQTLHVIDAVTPGNDLGTDVVASGLHKTTLR